MALSKSKKKNSYNENLLCPVCGRYGKFDGKECGRCGSKMNSTKKKFVYKISEVLKRELEMDIYRERKVVEIDVKTKVKHDW